MSRIFLVWLSLTVILTSYNLISGLKLTKYAANPESLADVGSARDLELVGRIGGPSLAVAIQGDYAYLGYSFEFAVVDISNPEQSRRVGYIPLSANDVALDGSYAYVAGRQGLSVVDISRPEQPIQISLVTTPATVTDVALTKKYAFLVGAQAGLRLVDIADPTKPFQVSFLDLPARVEDVAIVDKYVYLATADGLRVVDVTDLYQPVNIEVEPMALGAQAIGVRGKYAYVTVLGGLVVVDISNPAKPFLAGQLDIPGYVEELALSGNLAYLANGPEGVRLVDISDPTQPVLLNVLPLPGLLVDVATAGGYVYANNTSGGLFVIDSKKPATPLQVGSYQAPGPVKDVTVVGQTAYLTAGWEDELHILDVSDVASPTELGFYPTFGMLGWSVTDREYVVAAGGFGGPYAINVSRFSPTGDVDIANVSVAEFKPTYAYLVDKMGVLHILDVSVPDVPDQVGQYVLPGEARDVVVRGEVAFVAAKEGGVHILEISNPKLPTLISTIKTPGKAQALTVNGDHLYVAAGAGGLHIIDVFDPINPVIVSTTTIPGQVRDVAVVGDRAYVAGGENGVHIIDISDPSLPLNLGSVQTHAALGVAVSDDKLFIADGLGGLLILIQPQFPPIFASANVEEKPEIWDNRLYSKDFLSIPAVSMSLPLSGNEGIRPRIDTKTDYPAGSGSRPGSNTRFPPLVRSLMRALFNGA